MKTHFLAVPPLVYYIHMCDPIKCIQLGTVLTTSILYWRNPRKGFRRNMDIVAVFSTGVYNAYKYPYLWVPVGILSYCIWTLSNKKKKLWIHSLLHFIGSIAYFFTPSTTLR